LSSEEVLIIGGGACRSSFIIGERECGKKEEWHVRERKRGGGGIDIGW
jgi:hypothetical protein